jgi:hypothetical protein
MNEIDAQRSRIPSSAASSIPRQLPLFPIRGFVRAIEHRLDVPLERLEHTDVGMHQWPGLPLLGSGNWSRVAIP